MIKKLICAAALLMVAGLQHTRAQYVDFSVRVFLSASGGYPEALEL